MQQQQQIQHIQQQQQAMSRFPSNIDGHLWSPGLRSLHLQQQHQQLPQNVHQPPQPSPQQQQKVGGASVLRQGSQVELEMAQQDAWKVCNPDIKRPFSNLEDAVNRLLPYHVVTDFEAEEDNRILDSDTTGQVHSRLQQWDLNILAKIAEFTATFEKQVRAFNIMSRKRALGEFRAEERLMIEQTLLQEEKKNLLQIRAEFESREKAGREAAEAKMRMAMVQAEQARVEAQAHAEMIARAPMRGNAIGSHPEDCSAHYMAQEQGGSMDESVHGWGNANRDEGEPSDDFLNDENEPENEETGLQDEWREVGELDLNTR